MGPDLTRFRLLLFFAGSLSIGSLLLYFFGAAAFSVLCRTASALEAVVLAFLAWWAWSRKSAEARRLLIAGLWAGLLATTAYDIVRSRSSFSLPATTFGIRSAARRHWIHDVHDPGAAWKLRADRASRRTAGIHAVQRCGAAGSITETIATRLDGPIEYPKKQEDQGQHDENHQKGAANPSTHTCYAACPQRVSDKSDDEECDC